MQAVVPPLSPASPPSVMPAVPPLPSDPPVPLAPPVPLPPPVPLVPPLPSWLPKPLPEPFPEHAAMQQSTIMVETTLVRVMGSYSELEGPRRRSSYGQYG